MKIIIVGCGKVGYTLVEQLGSEDHDIVVIDEKPEKVSTITNNLDAMGIVGNGINHQTLIDAGITTADLLIAVTGDDEKNLLCCVIARKTGHCQTIARVRNPIYNKEKELYRIIRDYGEDKFAKNIAKHIVAARQVKPITTTGELTEIIRESIPMKMQVKSGHPAKRTFQAIRIELNRELDVLRDSLDGMIDILDDGGRLCIITFHSLEDRIVKTIFRKNENPCTCPSDFPVCVCGKKSKGKVITRKPILPGETEMEENPRSKSAKLRIFERVL